MTKRNPAPVSGSQLWMKVLPIKKKVLDQVQVLGCSEARVISKQARKSLISAFSELAGILLQLKSKAALADGLAEDEGSPLLKDFEPTAEIDQVELQRIAMLASQTLQAALHRRNTLDEFLAQGFQKPAVRFVYAELLLRGLERILPNPERHEHGTKQLQEEPPVPLSDCPISPCQLRRMGHENRNLS